MDREDWRATVHSMTEQLSMHTHYKSNIGLLDKMDNTDKQK